jgi:hypothetical protein
MNRYSKFEVLQIVKADFLLRSQVDAMVDGSCPVNEDTSLEDWIDMCDLLPLRYQRAVYNDWFKVTISEDQWYERLTPVRTKTVGDLCGLISENASRLQVDPIRVFGHLCQEAAVFRLMIHERKVIGPSTPFSSSIMEDSNWKIFQIFQLIKPGMDIRFNFRISKRFNFIVWKVPAIMVAFSFIVYYWSGVASITILLLLGLHICILNNFPRLYSLFENKYDFLTINGCNDLKQLIRKEVDGF